jgi:hypothetical protein
MGRNSEHQFACVRACLALLAVRFAAAAVAPLTGGVIALTDRNFDRLVNHTSPWMIEIYAPW